MPMASQCRLIRLGSKLSGIQVGSKWDPSGIQVGSKWDPSGIQTLYAGHRIPRIHVGSKLVASNRGVRCTIPYDPRGRRRLEVATPSFTLELCVEPALDPRFDRIPDPIPDRIPIPQANSRLQASYQGGLVPELDDAVRQLESNGELRQLEWNLVPRGSWNRNRELR